MENIPVKFENMEVTAVTAEDIKKYLCPLATEKELYLALNIIKSFNLNPFKREVHLIKYKADAPISIIVGYEVYLKRAERTGKLDGWSAKLSDDGKYAIVIINRKDWKEPFVWTVNLAEFNKKQSTWNQIPEFMAKKVAIAQGFRLAFPDELGGMPYTKEETEVFNINSEEVPENKKANVKMPEALTDKSDDGIPEFGEQQEVKPTNAYAEMLNKFKKAKAIIGAELYYKILDEHGLVHANDIKDMALAEEILKLFRANIPKKS